MDKVEEILTRGVANIISGKKELFGKLHSKKKFNIYFGIDPTSTKIHLGHAVPLRKLNEFAKLGHNVTFLIGDFTALIGDTSDKDSERPALTKEEIEENFKTYKKQAEKVLDFSKIKIRYNSEWLKKLNFEEILKLMQHFSTGDFTGRELVKKRLNDNKRVGLHELLYPVMQGYDSLMLNTDLQIGGTDQTFNMQAGRTLIKDIKNKESFVLTTQILEGTNGRKMSKSWGNAIWLDDSAIDIYRKVMAVPDEFILNYFLLATNLSAVDIKIYEDKLGKGENPINIKKELAFQIVKELYNEKSATKAQKEFEKVVQNKELPKKSETLTIKASDNISIIDVVSKITKSRSQGKRLLEQGGISIDDNVTKDLGFELKNNQVLKIGKRKIVRLVIK
jgi:tyrosyl-tRNA synthetase